MQKSSNFIIESEKLESKIIDENSNSYESTLLNEMREFEEFKVWVKLKSEIKR